MGQVPMKTPILTREIGVGRRPYVPASSSAPFCMFSCQLDSNSSVSVGSPSHLALVVNSLRICRGSKNMHEAA